MSSKVPMPPPGFDELSTDDQIEYLNELWDRISSDPEKIPVPDWHMEIVRERLERYGTDRTGWITLEELEKKLLEDSDESTDSTKD
jgi:putative addiction module component (TIGR02574 family)